MKIALLVLGLFVVSALAVDVQLRPIHFKIDQIYSYNYTGHVLTGLPASGSSLYSGHQLNATIELSVIKSQRSADKGKTIIKMELTDIVVGHLLTEVTEVEKAIFTEDTFKQQSRDILSYPVQFTFSEETDSFEWVEVQKNDAPWSINIKKSIIDLLQVNILGKQAQRASDDVYSAEVFSDIKLPNGLTSFGVHESTIQGECETNYQVIQTADPSKLRDTLPGADKFYFTVTKTRNFDNCVYQPKFGGNNWDRKGCVEYCKRFAASTHLKMDGLNKHLPTPDTTETNCACDPKEAYPVEQYSTIRYNISMDAEDPIIGEVLSKGKIVVDNHGTKFVVYSRSTLQFVSEQIKRNVPLIPEESVIRVNDLVFTLFPYKGMEAQTYPSHVIPVFNLLIPKSFDNLVAPTVDLLGQVAKILMEGNSDIEETKITWSMVQVIQNLAHIPARDLKRIFDDEARIEDNERFTNTEHSVVRQLLLDALAQVGTKDVAEWFKMVLEEKSLSAYEIRQFVETLPRNVYAPSRTLITLIKQQIEKAIDVQDYDLLSAYAVTYGKLISKACRFDAQTSSYENSVENRYFKINRKASSRRVVDESIIDWPESDEQCTEKDAKLYIHALFNSLEKVKSLNGKVILAQALTHSGQYEALKHLTPYITGSLTQFQCVGYENKSSASDCTFLRSSIIYALHHMVPVSPKLLRSLTLPIFQNHVESYELRLAAFTVFMAAGPKRHELQAVAATLRGENNRQVITMVRSILEETANLTQACHLPLAAAAREIIPTLPAFNFDGVYSKASYNEWYSEEKSTGFFLNGQFVANNRSFIPRNGYLSLGSHWKSLTNSWLTVAYQQKGLESALADNLKKIFSPEWFLAALSKSGKTRVEGENPVDELFKVLGITERAEEETQVKLFVKLYERTSLFTLDKWTINAAFEQFKYVVKDFTDRVNGHTSFNWVRFFMPSGFAEVIPSSLGLPVVVLKQRPHIVALRLQDALIKPDMPSPTNFAIEATLVPQVYYTSSMSVSVFQHGLRKNYGAYSMKKTNVYVPIKIGFNLDVSTRDLTYSVEPITATKIFHSSNKNRAFRGINYVALPANESPIQEKREIESLVPAFTTSPRFQSRELGMDLELDYSTERPWFLDVEKIPAKGFPTWIIEKYAELNSYNYKFGLTLRANKKNPSAGFAGSFNYNYALSGDYREVKYTENSNIVHGRSMLKKLGHHEIDSVRITKEEIRQIAQGMVSAYPGIDVNRKAPTLARALSWSVRTLSQEDDLRYNATLYFIQALDYQTYWVKYVSTFEKPENFAFGIPSSVQIDASLARPALPSELKWEVPQLNKFIGKYVAKIVTIDTPLKMNKISISGFLHRTQQDEVLGEEMKPRSWYFEQCARDTMAKIHMSYACQVAANEESYFNKIIGTIEFNENLDVAFVNSTNLAYQAAKTYLNSYWRPWSTIASYPEKNVDGKIKFEARHSNAINGRPVVNFEVRTPRETSLWFKLFYPIERFTGFHPMMFQKASVLPKDQTCSLMVNHIRTFDNVTYPKPSAQCEYLLSADCSPARRFAVTVQENGIKPRVVKVFVGKQVILVKSVDKYQATIEVNGESRVVKQGQSHILSRPQEILAVRIFTQNAFIVIELPQEHTRIVTDGQLVKVVTSPIYMGKTCGLCGNQDQEAHMELQGPQNCIYDVVEDFQNAYSLGECHNTPPTVPPHCDLVPAFSVRKDQRERRREHRRLYNTEQLLKNAMNLERDADIRETMITKVAHIDADQLREGRHFAPVRRTLFTKMEGKNCFSKHIVPTCLGDEVADGSFPMDIPLACFPPTHPVFDKWVDDAEERIIHELEQFPSTSNWSYDAPIVCLKKETSTRGI